MSTVNPYAPPRGAVYDLAAREGIELAGRGQRLGAFFVDGIVSAATICLPAVIVMVAAGAAGSPRDEDAMLGVAWLLMAIGAVAWAWITILLVARNGQTIGKRLLEIKVVRADGSRASLGRIFWLRNVVNTLLGMIPLYGLVDLLFIFGVRRQCIHDLLADTIVIKA